MHFCRELCVFWHNFVAPKTVVYEFFLTIFGAATDKHGLVREADKDTCHKNSQRRILSKCEPSRSMIGAWTHT